MVLVYIMAFYVTRKDFQDINVLLLIGGLVIYLATLLVLTNVIQKNDLTQGNTYAPLLFAIFSALMPVGLVSFDILLANLILLIALRSLLSLRNEKQANSKIFDASLLVPLAVLCYFWSILYFILIFLAIAFFANNSYKNWLIPFVGVTTVYILTTCFYLVFYDSFIPHSYFLSGISLDFTNYLDAINIFTLGVLIICTLFFLTVYIAKFRRKPAVVKSVLRLIIFQFVIGFAVIIFAVDKNASELYLLASPLALIATTYFETDINDIAKEINIWVLLLLPFTLLLF